MDTQEMTIEQATAQLEFNNETIKSLGEKLANKEIETSQLTTLVNRLSQQLQQQQQQSPLPPPEVTDEQNTESPVPA